MAHLRGLILAASRADLASLGVISSKEMLYMLAAF